MSKQNSFKKQLSFEFFPAKNPTGKIGLEQAALHLGFLNPEFFSITSGAGGTKPLGTLETALSIRQLSQISTVPHLVCTGAKKEEISILLHQFKENGIKSIVALRGDLQYPNEKRDFHYASDLVKFIRQETGEYFTIYVAAYPEYHPEMNNPKTELQHFKAKIEAGANAAITQYFFNVDAYFYFLDTCSAAGISIPVVPGIMPISNYEQLNRFSQLCGAEIPRWIKLHLENQATDIESIYAFGCEVITSLCIKLLSGGAPGLHFYTLNKFEPTASVCKNLNILDWHQYSSPLSASVQADNQNI